MANSEPIIKTVTTKTREIDLAPDDVERILMNWAKDNSFSHRAEVWFRISSDGDFLGVQIKEEITTTKEGGS